MAEVAPIAILIAAGQATRYHQGTMEEVVANRVRWGQLPPGTDPSRCIALLDDCNIGKRVWLEAPDGRIIGPLIVADCAQAEHRQMLRARRWAVDLNYALAVELGVIDRPVLDFKVWSADPRSAALRDN